jgi:hypothetical protein
VSFIRFGEQGSNVYVYPGTFKDGRDYYDCCGCSLDDDGARFEAKSDMRKHLLDHRAAGDVVPDRAFDELEAWDFDVAEKLGEWIDAGRREEFASYDEAWKAAAVEVADFKARTVAHAGLVVERLTDSYAGVLPPDYHFVFNAEPTEGNP